ERQADEEGDRQADGDGGRGGRQEAGAGGRVLVAAELAGVHVQPLRFRLWSAARIAAFVSLRVIPETTAAILAALQRETARESPMLDESAFLRAIAEDQDDSARLAFADWLEERGDPRAPGVRDPA